MNKKRIKFAPLIAPILSALSLGSVCVGTTFALFAKDVTTSIHSEAGNIEVATAYTNLKAYSLDETDPNHELLKEVTTPGVFDAHGTYSLDTSTGALSLVGLVPGDKVTFHVKYTNNSNVDIKHKMFVRVSNDTGLYSGLNLKATRSGVDSNLKTSLSRYFTKKLVSDVNKTIDEFDLTVELPVSAGIEFNNKRCDILVGFEVIQGNAWTPEANTTLGFNDSVKVEASGTTPAHFEHHIASKSEFKNMVNLIQAGGQSEGINKADENTVYIIDGDIDFGGQLWTSDELAALDSFVFTGKLEGNGQVVLSNVSNSTATHPIRSDWDGTIGLFAKAINAEFKNITLSDFSISGDKGIGLFVAGNNDALSGESSLKFENCIVESSCIVDVVSNSAAFVGSTRGIKNVVFENCVNNATVLASSTNIGAFVGTGTTKSNGGGDTIEFYNCVNNGDIYGSGFVGGFTGNSSNSDSRALKMKDCVNNGDIYGGTNLGYFIGADHTFKSFDCDNNVNTGKIYVTGKTTDEAARSDLSGSEFASFYQSLDIDGISTAEAYKANVFKGPADLAPSFNSTTNAMELTLGELSYDSIRVSVRQHGLRIDKVTGGEYGGPQNSETFRYVLTQSFTSYADLQAAIHKVTECGYFVPSGVNGPTASYAAGFDTFKLDSSLLGTAGYEDGYHVKANGEAYIVIANTDTESDQYHAICDWRNNIKYEVTAYKDNVIVGSGEVYYGRGAGDSTYLLPINLA